MKKFIILLLLMFTGVSAFCEVFPSGSDQFVKLGGNLELIIKKANNSFYQRYQTPKYGVRQNGVILLEPEYSSENVIFPADLFILVFINTEEMSVHIYSTETGEEVLTHYWSPTSPEAQEKFLRFEFRETFVDGKRKYLLIEHIEANDTSIENIVATFRRRRVTTYMSLPNKRATPISYHY